MAERKQVNKYYPPDWRPEHGSVNKFQGTHALRDRARKLNQGILIVRFEMPCDVWCEGCGNHVGMGVRYNAEKTRVGKYYTTNIYQFRMKCHLCDNKFEIKTDPKNCDYEIVGGCRRKLKKWDLSENEQVVPTDHGTAKSLALDPMYKLEHGVADKEKLVKVIPTLNEIQSAQADVWKDDFAANQTVRKIFRDEKKLIREKSEREELTRKRLNLAIKLLPESEEDRTHSKYYRTAQERERRLSLPAGKRRDLVVTGVKSTRQRKLRKLLKKFSIPDSRLSSLRKLNRINNKLPKLAAHLRVGQCNPSTSGYITPSRTPVETQILTKSCNYSRNSIVSIDYDSNSD